ncbi:MAG: hypothetical protein KAS62_00120 [Candidatus Delongbacteria bacterium]|nr:hypothetical protein [Candidatus Delongbacteria bacterium]
MNKFILIIIFSSSLIFSAEIINCVINPYENINWAEWDQYKANFHTHTTESDGYFTLSEAIDRYDTADYKILAITDHDHITWPWTDYGRDPDSLGMLAVKGDEYSHSLHVNAFFNFTLDTATMEEGIPHVEASGGLSHINHPGRTMTPEDWEWYMQWYQNYSSCMGLEVFNKGDLYPDDRKLWDNINMNLFDRDSVFVWGFSNDDMHTVGHLYHNFQFMLMPSLSEEDLRDCMTSGAFYFSYDTVGSGSANVPRLDSLKVDHLAKTINISAVNYDSLKWIGPGTLEVGNGEVFSYSEYTNKQFVRAILYGADGTTYTQPFGFLTIDTSIYPTTPTNISTEIRGNDLLITWDISEDADNYDIYSSDDPEGVFTIEGNVIENQYQIPLLEAKKFYYIVAKNSTKIK